MNQWQKLRNMNAGSNLVDAGRCAVHGCPMGMVDSEAGCNCRWGGRAEGLRRRHGDAAGVMLSARPGRSIAW